MRKSIIVKMILLPLFIFVFSSFLFAIVLSDNSAPRRLPDQQQQLKKFRLQIHGYSPTQDDDYVAVSFKAEPGYIVKFEALAHADRVHHILLYGCTQPAYTDRNFWQGGATCGSGNHILYAWARNAPPLVLPDNVGFSIGNTGDSVQYLVMQIHYAHPFVGNVRDFSGVTLHLSQEKPCYLAGVYLFLSGDVIEPGYPAFYTNMSCPYTHETKLHPFAFRTHTHEMGRVVSAYVKKAIDGKWMQIGKRNPQWPQLFQMRDSPLVIEKGDFMAATCRYDSSNKTEPVPMGSMGVNEMCNFYMMYYQEANDADPFPYGAGCFGQEHVELRKEYPNDGMTLLPAHPEWEHQAHQSGKPFGILEIEKVQKLEEVKLGQVAGLAVDPTNARRLFIFHRAGRFWDQNTFDMNNRLNDQQPINEPVLLVAEMDPNAGDKLKLRAKYGSKRFYLPHGIFVDQKGFIYTTDVGSHQVIKWQIKNDELEPVWILGEKFVAGSDQGHFCKPAGIVVSSLNGAVFIADGYCNNRIMKFSSDGKFLTQFGRSVSRNGGAVRLGEFALPHDIVLDEEGNRVFVADRENGRVQAFRMSDGMPLYEVKNPELYPTVYSVNYQQNVGLLFVPGTSAYSQSGQATEIDIYVAQPNSTQIQYAFRPQSDFLHLPHVLRAAGQHIWLGEIDHSQGVLWHLKIQSGSNNGDGALHAEHQMKQPERTMAMGNNAASTGMFTNLGASSLSSLSGFPLHASSSEQFALGSALVLLLVLCSVCCAFYLILWKCCCAREQDLFDKKGFKPLRMDLSEDGEMELSSSDSETETSNRRSQTRVESGI